MAVTPVEKFGKDHWSTFAYVETCCVDGKEGVGQLERQRMRCNPERHPLLHTSPGGWRDAYSTRLAGFFDFADRNDPEKAIEAGLMLRGHDDWDCLDDLEAAGLIEVQSLANGFVTMTEKGMEVAGELRTHKAAGGHFAGFRLGQEASLRLSSFKP